MSISYFTTVMTIINFFILYFVLRHFLFKPVNDAISSRESDITGRIKKSQEDMEKAEALRIENEKALKAARDEGKNMVENFKARAEKLSSEIIQDARSEAQTLMERARTEVEREKDKAMDEIRTQVVDLAVILSSKALEESINEDEHRRLIQDFITKVGI